MLAIAPAPTTTVSPSAIRTDLVLPRTITVSGRVCSPPTLSHTITGVAVAHFLLDCDDLRDPRMQVLAHPRTSIVDVTVWGPDAAFVAYGPRRGLRRQLINEAAHRGERALWDWPDLDPSRARHVDFEAYESRFAPPIRQTVRIAVEGTPRRGLWHPLFSRGQSLPLGLVAEGMPRVIGPGLRA